MTDRNNKDRRYVVSTLNRDGSVSAKMLSSFSGSPSHVFSSKKEAIAKRDEMDQSRWAEITDSSGRWVVVNTNTRKPVTR